MSENNIPITWDQLVAYKDANGYWYGAVALRLQSWYLISISVSYMSLFFSLSAVLDLYSLLKNPFASSEKRIKKYIMISIVLAIGFASIGLALTKSKNDFYSELNYRVYQVIAISNLLAALTIMVLVILRFRKKGMNQNIKQ